MVRRRLPGSVYRLKGIVHADAHDQRLAQQVVGRRTRITELGPWDGVPRQNRVVAIGRDIDADLLRGLLEACIAPRPAGWGGHEDRSTMP